MENLEKTRRFLKKDSHLSGFEVKKEGGELHLTKDGDSFARLIPMEGKDTWRMQYCHNLERWECIDFEGPLEECLDFLSKNPHYLFWEG